MLKNILKLKILKQKKKELQGIINIFSVTFNVIDANDLLDINIS